MKACRGCGMEKEASAYGVNRAMRDGLQPKCQTCIRERRQALKGRVVEAPREKVCHTCHETLPRAKFSANSAAPDKLQAICRSCSREYQLTHRYGITSSRYAELLAEQDGRCAICEVEECVSGKAFAVDHDHACCPTRRSCGSCVRALLCWNCNHTLGVMRDDPKVYQRAIDYLSKTRRRK